MKVYDFKNPADFAELERQANSGTIDYSMFPPATYRYFDKLKKLYADFREGKITKEEAVSKKRKYHNEYTIALDDYEKWLTVWKGYQDNIRTAGTKLSAVEKSKTAYDIAVNACEVIGLMIGDAQFCARQMKKIEGNQNDL